TIALASKDKYIIDPFMNSFMEPPFQPFNEMVNQTFLVDPLGNYMMRYSKDETGKGILLDLRRLLKYNRF
ncbi:hypothetical protein ACQZV8_03025, partial [Magnetococcales bacterium HHB-1]